MISRLQYSSEIVNFVPNLINTALSKTQELVNKVGLTTIFFLAVSVPLLLLHDTTFFIGFLGGIVFDQQLNLMIEKVQKVFYHQNSWTRKIIVLAAGGILFTQAKPMMLLISSLFVSARWGYILLQKSRQIDSSHPVKDRQTHILEINRFSINLLVQIGITAAGAYLFPSLFALGLTLGVVFDDKVKEIAEKINVIFYSRKITMIGLGGFCAFMKWPLAFGILTVYKAAEWGARIQLLST